MVQPQRMAVPRVSRCPPRAAPGGVPTCHKDCGSRAQAVRARSRAGLLLCGCLPCVDVLVPRVLVSTACRALAIPGRARAGSVGLRWARGCQSWGEGTGAVQGAHPHQPHSFRVSPPGWASMCRPQPPGSLRFSTIVSSQVHRVRVVRAGARGRSCCLPGSPAARRGSCAFPLLPSSSPGSSKATGRPERGARGWLGRAVKWTGLSGLWSAPGVRSQVLGTALAVGLFLRMELGRLVAVLPARPPVHGARPPGAGPLNCSPFSP